MAANVPGWQVSVVELLPTWMLSLLAAVASPAPGAAKRQVARTYPDIGHVVVDRMGKIIGGVNPFEGTDAASSPEDQQGEVDEEVGATCHKSARLQRDRGMRGSWVFGGSTAVSIRCSGVQFLPREASRSSRRVFKSECRLVSHLVRDVDA